MRHWSIKIRLAIGISLLVVVALVGMLQVVLGELRARFEHTIGQDISLLVTTHAMSLDSRFENAKRQLQAIADAAPDGIFDAPDAAQRYADEQRSALRIFDLGLYIASADEILLGIKLLDHAAAQKRRGTKTAAHEANARARATKTVQISQPYASPSCGGCPAVVVIVPVFNARDEFRGFVAGALRLDGDNLLAALARVRVGEAGYLYLVTRDRTMIMHPDSARIMKLAARPGQNLMFDKAVDEGFRGFGRTVNSTGEAMIVAFQPLESTGWILAANYPAREAERPFDEARSKVYAMAIGLGIVLLLLVWEIMRRLLAPLARLTGHVAQLGNAGAQRQIELEAGGEIGTLGDAFNKMMADLDHRQAEQARIEGEMRRLNANLERIVSERTAALIASNEELEAVISRLTIAQKELVEAEKLAALGALVAGIAHELNTPIGNCTLIASKLSEQADELSSGIESGKIRKTELQKHLDELHVASGILGRNLDKAAALIASFKQIAVDRSSEARRRFLLDKVLTDTVLMMQPMLKQANCTVAVALPAGIEMDSFPGSLGQSIGALLENATVHAYPDRTGGRVDIRAERSGDSVTISVQDSGAGISRENLEHIFDPFFTTRLGQGGSGLGLHIVYNLVTGMLGGRIAVESTPGAGTHFRLTLPLTVQDAGPASAGRAGTKP